MLSSLRAPSSKVRCSRNLGPVRLSAETDGDLEGGGGKEMRGARGRKRGRVRELDTRGGSGQGAARGPRIRGRGAPLRTEVVRVLRSNSAASPHSPPTPEHPRTQQAAEYSGLSRGPSGWASREVASTGGSAVTPTAADDVSAPLPQSAAGLW